LHTSATPNSTRALPARTASSRLPLTILPTNGRRYRRRPGSRPCNGDRPRRRSHARIRERKRRLPELSRRIRRLRKQPPNLPQVSPAVSGNPSQRFMIWTAWPLAPLTRLSSAEVSTKLPVLGVVHGGNVHAIRAHTWAVSGVSPEGSTWTKGPHHRFFSTRRKPIRSWRQGPQAR
jgi:hypothetical protein